MRNLIISTMLFAATSSFADFKNVEVSNFTGSYQKPDGTATASRLVVPESITSTINISLKGVEDGYLLEYGDSEFHLKNPPAFIDDIETANWSNINFKTEAKTMSTSLTNFNSEVKGSRMALKGLSGNCSLNRDHTDNYGLQILDACLTNSRFSISSLISNEISKAYDLLIDVPGMIGVNATAVTIKNAKFSSKRNSFTFKGKVNLGISANITIEGKSNYEIDKNRVSVRIDKAKASFINIKKKLFEELEKSETDTLRVESPYIYIYLK